MLPEFVSLMAMTAFLIFLSAILQAPLLEEANPNVTPNPAKAPWYFWDYKNYCHIGILKLLEL